MIPIPLYEKKEKNINQTVHLAKNNYYLLHSSHTFNIINKLHEKNNLSLPTDTPPSESHNIMSKNVAHTHTHTQFI